LRKAKVEEARGAVTSTFDKRITQKTVIGYSFKSVRIRSEDRGTRKRETGMGAGGSDRAEK